MKYKDSFNQCKHNSTACETRPHHDGWLSWLARNCGAAPFKYIIDSVWSVQWAEPTQGPAWGQECKALFRSSRRPHRTLGLPVGPTALRPGCGWGLQLPDLAEHPRDRSELPLLLEKGPLGRVSPKPRLIVLRTEEMVGTEWTPECPLCPEDRTELWWLCLPHHLLTCDSFSSIQHSLFPKHWLCTRLCASVAETNKQKRIR